MIRIQQVLIISSADSATEVLTDLVRSAGFSSISVIKSGGEARRSLAGLDCELILINAPLSDEIGDELALFASEVSTAGVLLLIKNAFADDVAAKVEDAGVLVVGKPILRPFFFQAAKLASTSHKRILGLKHENDRLQDKIMEIRLVDRAKCILIQYLDMSEKEAHRHIEKLAMDKRKTRREIAESILHSYEE